MTDLLSSADLLLLVLRKDRAAFAEIAPSWMLVGISPVADTGDTDSTTLSEMTHPANGSCPEFHPLPSVTPIRKVQTSSPEMITVGRTSNNDVIIPNRNVSRFHAYFQLSSGHLELVDAGSRHGTWVASERLRPRDLSRPLASGDTVRFADQAFSVLDGAHCWDEFRRRLRIQESQLPARGR